MFAVYTSKDQKSLGRLSFREYAGYQLVKKEGQR